LFVEEMAALVSEDGDVAVPPTIQALLAARLDRLRSDERTVIERGAVEGKVFHRSAVAELAPETNVEPHLASLVRKELIRPDRRTKRSRQVPPSTCLPPDAVRSSATTRTPPSDCSPARAISFDLGRATRS